MVFESSCEYKSQSGWFNRLLFPTAFGLITTTDTKTNNSSAERIKLYESSILAIASASYSAMNVDLKDVRNASLNISIRYLDWLLTTPLLALIIYEYASIKNPSITNDYEDWWFGFLPVVMVTAGWIAIQETSKQKDGKPSSLSLAWIAVSWCALLVLIYLIYSLSLRVDLDGLEWFFYIGWTCYGLVYFIPDYCSRVNALNVLDFINKIVFSLYITFVLLGDF